MPEYVRLNLPGAARTDFRDYFRFRLEHSPESELAIDLLNHMLVYDTDQRISAQDALEH